jgi:hypothetical protein
MLRFLTKMKVEVATLNVCLLKNSIVDLRSSKERLKQSLAVI